VYIFVNKYSCISVLETLYNKILHKCEFCQAHYVRLFKRVHTKFNLPFLDIPTSYYEFWKFEIISVIYLNKKEKRKGLNSAWAEFSPWLRSFGCGGLRSGAHWPAGVARPTRGGRPTRCSVARVTRSALWSPRGGHALGGALARPAPLERRSKHGKVFEGSITVRRANQWTRRLRRGLTQNRGAPVERWGGAARWRSTADDAALVLHHRERGRKVRWGPRNARRGTASSSPSGRTAVASRGKSWRGVTVVAFEADSRF
jgi:hypothetical protein